MNPIKRVAEYNVEKYYTLLHTSLYIASRKRVFNIF